MTIVATIGYEGASIAEFVAALERDGVSVLVDVRDVPWSRKPDFCKFPLNAALDDAGIEYKHLQALGNPEAGRDAAKSGDVDLYRSIYAGQLASEPAEAALAEVTALAAKGLPCLMCCLIPAFGSTPPGLPPPGTGLSTKSLPALWLACFMMVPFGFGLPGSEDALLAA